MVGDRNFGVFVLKERIPLLELPMHYQVWLAKNGIHNDGDVAQYEFAKVAQSRELKSALLCCLSLLRKGKTSEWLAERLLSLERGRRKLCEQKKMTEAEEGEWKRAQVQRMRRTASDSRKHDTTATKAMTEYKKANPKAGQGVLKQVHDAKLKELKDNQSGSNSHRPVRASHQSDAVGAKPRKFDSIDAMVKELKVSKRNVFNLLNYTLHSSLVTATGKADQRGRGASGLSA